MDIGVPYRVLGHVDISEVARRLKALPDARWTHTDFNRQAIAGKEHSVAMAIYLRKDWHPRMHKFVRTNMWDVVEHWGRKWGGDRDRVRPFMREDYGGLQVYTFWEMLEWHDLVAPILDTAAAALRKNRIASPGREGKRSGQRKAAGARTRRTGLAHFGVWTRVTFVKLPSGHVIDEHIDGQAVAALTHRVHVAVSGAAGVEYRCDGQSFRVTDGDIFELNNRRLHAVFNHGPQPRINMMLEYYPDPDPPRFALPRFRGHDARK
ncbi:MAG: aspartyl/asparaginyl beta-hydroxylase domain-containing protein, partial [Kiloniellaceae bacterium]